MIECYYTGIGSRKTPIYIQKLQAQIAKNLSNAGYILRSGAADGSDSAFALGAGDRKHIYLPWNGFKGLVDDNVNHFVHGPSLPMYLLSDYIVNQIHPAPDKLSSTARLLHCRNIHQVVGHDLPLRPSKFVLFYAEEDSFGNPIGGTRTAVMYAAQLGIKCYNLIHPEVLQRVLQISETLRKV